MENKIIIEESNIVKHYEQENKLLRELIMKLVQESNLKITQMTMQVKILQDQNKKLARQNGYLEQLIG